MHLIGKPNSDFTFKSEMVALHGDRCSSQFTPQQITGPLFARAPGLLPRLAQWLIRP